MRFAVAGAGTTLSLGALILTLLTIVPAPSYAIWRVSVGAIELSLWLGALGLMGALLGILLLRSSNILGSLILICGMAAFGLGLLPFLRARTTAAHEGQRLSLIRYFTGFLRPAPAIEIIRDLVFAEVDGQSLRLDVYRRPPSAGTSGSGAPAVVVAHGGSWSGGAKGEFPAWSHALADAGYVVFDVEYRLAGPGRHSPIQAGDVKCAIGWVKRNAAAYGVAPDRIALLGRSAGGQLALLAAYTPNNQAATASCPSDDTSVQAVVSFYAPVDLTWGYNNPSRPDLINGQTTLSNYVGGAPTNDAQAYLLASPSTHVNVATPPTLVIHGGHDRIVGVQHTGFLEEALKAAEVPHRVVRLPWADHGFDFFFDGWGSQIAQPIIRDFLGEHLD